MIFFAIFIVNSFLNSGLGYVCLRGDIGNCLNSDIGCALNLNGGSSFWSSLCSLLFLRSVTLVSLFERNWSWVREWVWINEIFGTVSGISFNFDLSRNSDVSGVGIIRTFNFIFSFGLNFDLSSNCDISSLLNRGRFISRVSLSLHSGIGSFDCGLSDISGLFFLLFLPLSSSFGKISITLGNFINLNISLNIFLLWRWSVHKGSSLGDVCVLIIIDTSILWISIANIVFVVWVKSIVSSLAYLSEGFSIFFFLVFRWWRWSELSSFRVDMAIIVH